ncbi:MAG: hypothetical protein ABW004_10410, partial [Aeromicrobium sp.]
MTKTEVGLEVRTATQQDLDWMHALRHDVYAEELGQHAPTTTGRLHDGLDGHNVYLVAAAGGRSVAFVSLTPPWAARYGLEKYVTRDELPVLDADGVFEVRILTVDRAWRG